MRKEDAEGGTLASGRFDAGGFSSCLRHMPLLTYTNVSNAFQCFFIITAKVMPSFIAAYLSATIRNKMLGY